MAIHQRDSDGIEFFIKDPNEILDYAFPFGNRVPAAESDPIASVAWSLASGITNEGQAKTDTVATVFIGGGTAGSDYEVEGKATTDAGRVFDKRIRIKVRDI